MALNAGTPLTARSPRPPCAPSSKALGYTVARYVYEPGTVFPDHKHGVDKIDAVVSGRFRLVVRGHMKVLTAGDWIEIPRGTVHNAAVIGDEPVVSLDAVKL